MHRCAVSWANCRTEIAATEIRAASDDEIDIVTIFRSLMPRSEVLTSAKREISPMLQLHGLDRDRPSNMELMQLLSSLAGPERKRTLPVAAGQEDEGAPSLKRLGHS